MPEHPAPPRDAHGRFVKAVPTGACDLPAAMLASGVPGALLCDPPAEPIDVAGVVWTAEDAGPWAASIGLALAVETAGASA